MGRTSPNLLRSISNRRRSNALAAMGRIKRTYRWSSVAFLLLLGTGCNKVFDLSPYDALPAEDLRGLNAQHSGEIRAALAGNTGPLTFALTSDPHYHYSDLSDIVAHINADPSVAFTVVPGDLTDQGLLGEFEAFARVAEGLDRPWLALIGNHDHLGNGRSIFETMFGPRNQVLDVAGYRFILFDDTVWESGMPPDLDRLEQALESKGSHVPVVITHIPPFTDQLVGVLEQQLTALLVDAEVPLFIHGHLHRFNDHEPYSDGVRYLCVPWPEDRSYAKVTLDGTSVSIQHVVL